MLKELSELNDLQKNNLSKLNKLLNESINLHPAMCHYVTSLPESNKLCKLLFGDSDENKLNAYSLYL